MTNKHPNSELVFKVFSRILKRRRMREIKVEVIKYDVMSQVYCVGFTWGNFFETVNIPAELLDEVATSNSILRFAKIKTLLAQPLREIKKEIKAIEKDES